MRLGLRAMAVAAVRTACRTTVTTMRPQIGAALAESCRALSTAAPPSQDPAADPAARPIHALIMGSPGSGKGTLSARIAAALGLRPLSSGDLLRASFASAAARSQAPRAAEAAAATGALVDDALVCDLVLAELAKTLPSPSAPHHGGVLLDGFPRTVAQAEALDRWLSDRGIALDIAVALSVPWPVILKRIQDRWVHLPSGRTYNLEFNPPKYPGIDDLTGEPLSKRTDDCPVVFQSRLLTYQSQTLPLLDYYAKSGILRSFSGSSSDEIFPLIYDAFAHLSAPDHLDSPTSHLAINPIASPSPSSSAL